MSEKPKALVLDRCDPARNMSRFYALRIEPSLFGDTALVREWGRIGRWGNRRIEIHPTAEGAAEAMEYWLRRKQNRGYRVRGA